MTRSRELPLERQAATDDKRVGIRVDSTIGSPPKVIAMRQLFPTPIDDINIETCYFEDRREPLGKRPWVAVNTAMSADGATALNGRSKGIGGVSDHLAFHALRAAADFIVVGAGTAREEHYGPAGVVASLEEARRASGRTLPPRIALVTRKLDLDASSSIFTASPTRPLIFTVEGHSDETIAKYTDVADVVVTGRDNVDLRAALEAIAALGGRFALVEGGPSLNSQLIEDGLVDEWCVTLAGSLVLGPSRRAAFGQSLPKPEALVLDRVISDEADLLLRYVTARAGTGNFDQ